MQQAERTGRNPRTTALAAATVALAALVMGVLAAARPAHATSPGPNGKIVFESGYSHTTPDTTDPGSVWSGEIYRVNADGTGLQKVDLPSPDGYQWAASDPAISADGRTIVFSANRSTYTGWMGKPRIFTVPVSGGTATPVAGGYEPTFTPDGTQIVYKCFVGGGSSQYAEICAVPVGGGTPRPLTSNSVEDRFPAVSPDGKTVAYSQVSGGVFTVPLAGGASTQVASGSAPSFSPDGKTIAFAGARGGIYKVPVAGGKSTSLTKAGFAPSFSPDGKTIAYQVGDTHSSSKLYKVPATGGPATEVGVGRPGLRPDWGSPPSPKAEINWDWLDDSSEVQGFDENRMQVSFDGSGSEPIGEIASYRWDFGDGSTSTNAAPTHSYPDAGRYSVTLKVADKYGRSDAQTVSVTVNPVKLYAPKVYMHPEEQYFPGSASVFLDQSDLRWVTDYYDRYLADPGGNYLGGCESDLIAPVSLGRLSGKDNDPYTHTKTVLDTGVNGTYWCYNDHSVPPIASNAYEGPGEHPFNASIDDYDDSGFVLDAPDDPSFRRGDTGLDAPVYAEYSEAKHYVIYWFFYPFNGWHDKGVTEEHEGDWEHIVVNLDQNDNATDVAYYQHYCDPDIVSYDTVAKAGTHPVVYSALGGHASFPDVGDGTPVACLDPYRIDDNQVSPLDDVGQGVSWDTWNRVEYAKEKWWYGFAGNWGDASRESSHLFSGALDNYGPVGPGPSRSKVADAVPRVWLEDPSGINT
jgi:Tol biopolymer transport system component/PKD repeat protein